MVPLRDMLRAECYDDMFGKVWSPPMNVDLLRAMCESPRWRKLRVGEYVDEFDPETTKQFSACTFDLGDGALYVAYRGTDSSVVGWKEDFAMAFRRPVASQEAATRYLGDIAARWQGAIMVGAARGIDAEDRDVILAVVKGLAATAATSVIPSHQ
ncbi:putative hydrolase or acyl transferase [Bifidobacterium scardovii]|uniref:Putative hydrolase or acyl transferase n=1 Tax=Bifidobacterium scardovii TaxID=158787 RepID=A0A087D8Z6_9BIFI|nr:putative hydrolase or acyl transferase [Bifidobacterium scardovii]